MCNDAPEFTNQVARIVPKLIYQLLVTWENIRVKISHRFSLNTLVRVHQGIVNANLIARKNPRSVLHSANAFIRGLARNNYNK